MATTLQRWLGRSTEPFVLFPMFAVLLLGALWGTTLGLNDIERANATRAVATSSIELAETYEAQVVRALREIDLTLKVVKSAYENRRSIEVLADLEARGLLPPSMLFSVSLSDARGRVIAANREDRAASVAGLPYFEAQRASGADLFVSRPVPDPATGGWTLHFSRRMDDADGTFLGVALVAVDAAYFVSGYESSKLGEHGVLGLIGDDGVFRALRTGEAVTSGTSVDFEALLAHAERDDEAPLLVNSWDGVRRYTSVRRLYSFPLAVLIGLSQEEQFAPMRRNHRLDLGWAAIGSVLVLLFVSVLWRSSWQLAQSRRRAVAAQIDHAKRVEYLAYHDGLTGLPNRSLFSKLLSQGMTQARRYDRRLALLFLDLDRFKHINDTLGHEAGDQLLQTMAERLRECLRESDTVARLGGDEFVVLLPEVDEEKYVSLVAQKILTAAARPFLLIGHEFRVTASIGISVFPRDGEDEQTLTKNADIAMYHAKSEGKNNFQFYSAQLNTESLERLTLESSLRHALERNEFQLHYQPRRDIRSGSITGVEALLRWQHPDLGVLPPMQFIPIADETGLIIAIGRWVLRAACTQNVAWQRLGMPKLIVAVNLTPRQFTDERLVEDLQAILADTGMDPQLLELEITEGMLMHNVERTLRTLVALKRMRVRIAIDDFGLGYTSLATLQSLPLDTIKIDRSFIRDIANASEDRTLTEAIIAMGRSLSLTVVAQGVETKEQADFLRQHACDELQGFYFNRPLPADEFTEVLRNRGRANNVFAHPTSLKKSG